MHRLMQSATALGRLTPRPRLEAVLAATLLHLEDDDFVLPLPESTCAAMLPALGFALDIPQPTHDTLHLATGAALALKEAGNKRVALAYTRTGTASRTEPSWAAALRYAAQARLPLIAVCLAPEQPARAGRPGDLTFATLHKLAAPLHLPVLTVDGADAVALYRVMQESVLRARQGGGPAVLWCVLPAPTDRSATADPLRRLTTYLAARGLAPKPSRR
jgi:pyruvate dehydrogenase E1 component alpha subunit